jgi:tetratricopeptide (TPR) repeat protein
MSPVTSLTRMSEQQLNRWIKRIALLFFVVLVAFVAFYAIDRFRAPSAPIVDRQIAAAEAKITKDPKDIAARGELADLYVAKGRFDEAITQYDLILKTGRADELAYFGRARAYRFSERLDPAAADFQKVVDIAKTGEMAKVDPMLQSAYFSLGDIKMAQNKPADAIPFLEKALGIKRSDADALLLLGKAYFDTGRASEGSDLIRRAIEFVPVGWVDPYQALADGYTKAGKVALAEWAGAMVDFQSGSLDQAETRLKALAGGEAALDAAIGLGLLYETKGDLASAAEWYAKALVIDPKNNTARLGLGRVGGEGASGAPAGNPHPSLSAPSPAPSADGGNG